MSHVFISYKHTDNDFAEVLIRRLQEVGLLTWTDNSLRPGEEWRGRIDEKIRTAFALVVVITPESKASEYVTYEWAFAYGVGIPIIPVLLKTTTLHPRLEALQYLDFTNPMLRPWDSLFAELHKALRAHVPQLIPVPENSPPMLRNAIAAIGSWNKNERIHAVEYIGTVNFPERLEILRILLIHPLPEVREVARNEVGRLRDLESVPILLEFLNDNDAGIVSDVATVLGTIGDPRVLPKLLDLLKPPRSPATSAVLKAVSEILDQELDIDLSNLYDNSIRDYLEEMLVTGENDSKMAALQLLSAPEPNRSDVDAVREIIMYKLSMSVEYLTANIERLMAGNSLIAAYSLIALSSKYPFAKSTFDATFYHLKTSPTTSPEAREAIQRWHNRQ